MLNSIIKKEWLKLKILILILSFINIIVLIYFWFNLNFSFSTIEPESMMWYKFINLEQKPYFNLSFIFYLTGILIAIFQFIPERVRNRIKIMIHLPTSMHMSLFMHLFIGMFFVFFICLISSIFLMFILNLYYPYEILQVALKDLFFYFICSLLLYFGISGSLIEKNPKVSIFKFIVTLFLVFIFHKNIFTTLDLLWIVILVVMFFMVLDSFYSIKEQRLKNNTFKIFSIFSVLIAGYFSYNLYLNNYKHEFNKYYIFYSPIIKQFVYQKNFGSHQFEYGVKDKQTFNRKTYESYLPFVYWKNLDIQDKLPVKIDNESFDKKLIKASRLSFSYNPSFLNKQEVQMYPLFNPQSHIGMIKFPEEMICVNKDKIIAYNYDEKLDNKLTNEIEKLLKTQKIKFPIKNIWGKATNIKPYDLGYFFLDSSNRLFRINRFNNKINISEINYPKNIEIKFIRISENRQKKLAGYAISTDNSFYLIDYNTFEFKKLTLDNFNYKNMKLQLLSNPKYYLVRYTNKQMYYVSVFDKKFNKLAYDTFK